MSRTLLVVDDAMIIRKMIEDAVRTHGWEVVGTAGDGREAVEQYRRLRPQAVTLDLVMPGFDGLYALRGIREIDPHAKVLVLSAIEQKDVFQEALRAGAADFVVKPFRAAELNKALERLAPDSATASKRFAAPSGKNPILQTKGKNP